MIVSADRQQLHPTHNVLHQNIFCGHIILDLLFIL